MIIKLTTLIRATRLASSDVNITFNTRTEQTTEELSELDRLFQKDCIIAIKEGDSPFKEVELNDIDSIDTDIYDEKKSQAKSFRNILWLLAKQKLGKEPDEIQFNEFYRQEYTKIREHYKNKLL